jgi:rare lipoprotein A
VAFVVVKNHLKSHSLGFFYLKLKNMLKKTILLLSIFTIITAANAQKKAAPLKPTIIKTVVVKDSLKINIVQDSIQTDTIIDWKMFKQTARASYYANQFHGRKMANGKRFDMNKLSVAHKKLPFGTILKVTNIVNQKFVIVEVTDRGPFVKSREIDLSKKAFLDIANDKGSGLMTVKIEIME